MDLLIDFLSSYNSSRLAGPAVGLNSNIPAVDYKGLYLFYTPVNVSDPMCYKSRILTAAEASCAVSFSSRPK